MIGWGLLFISILWGRRVFYEMLASDMLLWIWLGFILGQGIWGSLCLFLVLAGALSPWIIYVVMMTGCVLMAILIPLPRLWRANFQEILSLIRKPFFASWIALGLIAILFLRGFSALLPSTVEDAIQKYW